MQTHPAPEPNYDESTVPCYALPPLLRMENGEPVAEVSEWRDRRRPELIQLFSEYVYGDRPPHVPFVAEMVESGTAFGGAAMREQVRLSFRQESSSPCAAVDVLIYRPAKSPAPLPVFLGPNFQGNATVADDPGILETASWRRQPWPRGAQASRWPMELALRSGYAVATFYYGDVAPDNAELWRDGVPQVAFPDAKGAPGSREPGAIAWWAWGLSRVLDYLETREEYDSRKVAVLGHSRQGKAALVLLCDRFCLNSR